MASIESQSGMSGVVGYQSFPIKCAPALHAHCRWGSLSSQSSRCRLILYKRLFFSALLYKGISNKDVAKYTHNLQTHCVFLSLDREKEIKMGLHAWLKDQPLYQDLNFRLVCVALISSLGAMGFGFDNGWWGSALGLSEFKRKYGSYSDSKHTWVIPGQRISVATGTGSAGIILGCLLAPMLTTKLGRKPTFLVLSVIKIVGITLEVTAVKSFWQLVVGRIVVYSAIGISSNVVPMYQSECAPARVRGMFYSNMDLQSWYCELT